MIGSLTNAELIKNLNLVNNISITKPLLIFNPHLYVMIIYIVDFFGWFCHRENINLAKMESFEYNYCDQKIFNIVE